ncbi:DUF2062 domain-containing protein [Paenibacillaceae bacterium]|nr:DUF2062 domain-containing protein [Paenibacillaceae bacterium]
MHCKTLPLHRRSLTGLKRFSKGNFNNLAIKASRKLRSILRKLRVNLILILKQHRGAGQISLGLVFGLFPCWFPTFGVGVAISLGLARLFRGNLTASLLMASAGSVLWPVLFFMNYKIGKRLRQLFTGEDGNWRMPLTFKDYWPDDYVEPAEDINSWADTGIDFLIGAMFNSVVMSVLLYIVSRIILSRYRLQLLRKLRVNWRWRHK